MPQLTGILPIWRGFPQHSLGAHVAAVDSNVIKKGGS
jgi:hypothetical protein